MKIRDQQREAREDYWPPLPELLATSGKGRELLSPARRDVRNTFFDHTSYHPIVPSFSILLSDSFRFFLAVLYRQELYLIDHHTHLCSLNKMLFRATFFLPWLWIFAELVYGQAGGSYGFTSDALNGSCNVMGSSSYYIGCGMAGTYNQKFQAVKGVPGIQAGSGMDTSPFFMTSNNILPFPFTLMHKADIRRKRLWR